MPYSKENTNNTNDFTSPQKEQSYSIPPQNNLYTMSNDPRNPYTMNSSGRTMPFGLVLLIIYAVFRIAYRIHFIWKISSIVMMNESSSLTTNSTLSSFTFWLPTLIILLFIPIIYFTFNRKETPVLICLVITSAYLAFNYIQRLLENPDFLLQNLERIGLYLVIPLLFIYYIKTSKSVANYFAYRSYSGPTVS
ncbi:hypothetical protein [Desulfovibrio litoralis]|uniref:Uncharacterized protein n=1 Tax=Desulfovibrio litoralis DSM 11393 TaxID=1121455 RepID=A0A1M7TR32_9BACT|nr:hypothetical protein [Desulfovibrio litoralis]SHN73126.1 hypothetical protein SAMN02745728_02382 [Desulfovibrio litoralis DSM 11393]